MSDTFYRKFEDRHRGSRELIKSRLQIYAPFLSQIKSQLSTPVALDLGCGRGEWLEILGEYGFAAAGVDLDEGMLSACSERGFNVKKTDAIEALKECLPESLHLVSAFHVAEHLPFPVLRQLIDEALRVLKPGGLLILETPNPNNLSVGSSSFYLDPSHIRPLPPQLLAFATEFSGFIRVKVLGLQEAQHLQTAPTIGLFDVLTGVSPDYAVIAQKEAAPNLLAEFNPAFFPDYGLDLATLADRYDKQAPALAAKMLEHSGIRQQVDQLTSKVAGLEAKTVQLESSLDSILSSGLWRITYPIRAAENLARRLLLAHKENRLKQAMKNRLKPWVIKTSLAISKRPIIRAAAVGLLNRVPALKNRLKSVLQPPENSANLTASMSPETERIFIQLIKITEDNK